MEVQPGATDYVMFGHSGLFGDYVDIIHASGGRLRKVVTNLPDAPGHRSRRSFAEDLAAMNQWLKTKPEGRQIAREDLEDFAPGANESYVIGFRGEQITSLRDRLKHEFGLSFAPLIHIGATISPTVEIGEGAIVGAGSVVGAFGRLGGFCLINRGAAIGHHTDVGDFANIAPGVNIASGVAIGRAAVVGIGATIVNDLVIGARAMIAAGAVVTRDVEAGSLVAGMPARRVRRREAPVLP
jgi:sugar O-acyltransferase (sialic acid O-acetyltransferase NeuD family)